MLRHREVVLPTWQSTCSNSHESKHISERATLDSAHRHRSPWLKDLGLGLHITA